MGKSIVESEQPNRRKEKTSGHEEWSLREKFIFNPTDGAVCHSYD